MNKCPYCARPLSMGGMKCRACRRYVLGWSHITLLVLLGVAVLLGLFELVSRLS